MKRIFIIFIIFIMFIFSGCNRTKSFVNPLGDTNKETTVPITDTPSPSPTSNVPFVNPLGDTNKETTVPITDTPSPSPTSNVPFVNPLGDTNKETTVPITDTPSPSPTSNVPSDAQIIVEEPLLVERAPNYKALVTTSVAIATIACCIYAVNKYYATQNILPIDDHNWQAMTAQQQLAWAAEYFGINYNQDVPLLEGPEDNVELPKQQKPIECPRM